MPDTPLRLSSAETAEAVRTSTHPSNRPVGATGALSAPVGSEAADVPSGRGVFKTFYSLRLREFRFLTTIAILITQRRLRTLN